MSFFHFQPFQWRCKQLPYSICSWWLPAKFEAFPSCTRRKSEKGANSLQFRSWHTSSGASSIKNDTKCAPFGNGQFLLLVLPVMFEEEKNSNSEATSPFQVLPRSCLFEILVRLPKDSIGCAALVCRMWWEVIREDNSFWKTKFWTEFEEENVQGEFYRSLSWKEKYRRESLPLKAGMKVRGEES